MKTRFFLPSVAVRRKGIVMSCASALAALTLLAGPVQAEEAATSNQVNTETIASITETNISTESSSDAVATSQVQATVASTPATEETVTTNASGSDSLVDSDEGSGTTSASSETQRATSTETVSETKDRVTPGYYSDDQGNWYYRDAQGNNLTGTQTIDGQHVYFRQNGQQVKGALPKTNDFLERYYDVDSGQLLTNRFVEYKGNWYYLDADGLPVKGAQTINGQALFFHRYHGFQIKGDFDGYYSENSTAGDYYDPDSGSKVTTAGFVQNKRGETFYLLEGGEKATGLHNIDGNWYYFRTSGPSKRISIGLMEKNELITDSYSSAIPDIYYFDQDGHALRNQFFEYQKNWYYFGNDGKALRGPATIDGKNYYFNMDGSQVKGGLATVGKTTYYYDPDSGQPITNTSLTINGATYTFDAEGRGTNTAIEGGEFYADRWGSWYYKDRNGNKVKGFQLINGQALYFNTYGVQVKGSFAPDGRYYAADSGDLVTNAYFQSKEYTNYDNSSRPWRAYEGFYYADANGIPLKGEHVIDGQDVYFDKSGKQVKGAFRTDQAKNITYYYDPDSGAKVKNDTRTVNGITYTFDDQGHASKVN